MSIHTHQYFLRGFLLILLLLGAQAVPAADKPQPAPVKLKMVLLPYLTHAPFFIAEEEGYFAEEGIQIEFVRLPRQAEAVPSLAQSDLDVIGGATSVALLNAMARGARIKFVAERGYISSTGCTFSGLMARNTLLETGELDGPAQLKGRRISLILTTFTGYNLNRLLKKADLTLDDVEIKYLPANMRPEALESGTIDLTGTAEPWITRMSQAGQASLWISDSQELPDFSLGVVLYGPTLLEKNPDAGRRFMVAYLKAVRQYNLGKTERNLEILTKHTKLDKELLRQACWPSFRENGQINAQSITEFQDWAVKTKLLDSPVTVEQFWDPSFAEHANKVLEASPK